MTDVAHVLIGAELTRRVAAITEAVEERWRPAAGWLPRRWVHRFQALVILCGIEANFIKDVRRHCLINTAVVEITLNDFLGVIVGVPRRMLV